MRAARLLHILLLLQNRGRMNASQLATEVEVAPRTILRDIDALTEAGLPVVTYQGNRGGFELGFNYRTRLTGLATDEAEALAVLLADPSARLAELGMAEAAARATSKLLESFPDGVREKVALAGRRFQLKPDTAAAPDPRVAALADAVRRGVAVRLDARSGAPRTVHPRALGFAAGGWFLLDALVPDRPIPADAWRDINISSLPF
jgi:predicted DNA-binding transcriptional regulator YafY